MHQGADNEGIGTKGLRRLRDDLARVEAAAASDPTRIDGCVVEARLGGGGMGRVYRCREEGELPRRVAIKLMNAGLGPDGARRFARECKALAKLGHENVARVHRVGLHTDGRPYVVMELLEGPTLLDYCDARRLDVRARLRLFLDVCRGVAHAHERGVLHRDLKPDNVIVVDSPAGPAAKVVDFGIAQVADAAADGGSADGDGGPLTLDSHRFGTPHYVAPEQARSAVDADPRSDVYSLGAVLYELLCGTVPGRDHYFTRGETTALSKRLRAMTAAEAEEVASRRRAETGQLSKLLGGDLGRVPMRAMEHNPNQRYQSADDLRDDVQRWLDDKPLAAAPASRAYSARKWLRRNRRPIAAAAVLALPCCSGPPRRASSTSKPSANATGRSQQNGRRSNARLKPRPSAGSRRRPKFWQRIVPPGVRLRRNAPIRHCR